MSKDVHKRERGDGLPHDRTAPEGAAPGRPPISDEPIAWARKTRAERRSETVDRLPEDPVQHSAIWRRYEGPLARLAARSRNVGDLDTAHRQVNEAVALAAAAIRDAANADLAKTDCLAHMSHELRTPLSAIIGFAEVITQGLMAPNTSHDKALEYASDIKDAGHHLLALVNDILDIAKVEAGKHDLNEDLLDFPELAQSCLALVRESAAKSKVALESEIPDSCCNLVADGRKLKQVLVNLLSNAVKFTPEQGRVVLRAKPSGETGVEIAVTDSGVGMSEEEARLVLEPFTQFHGDLPTDQPGTGLGLPLAKALTELHGGTLVIESEPAVGTTIRVTLPRAQAERNSDPHATSETSRPKVA